MLPNRDQPDDNCLHAPPVPVPPALLSLDLRRPQDPCDPAPTSPPDTPRVFPSAPTVVPVATGTPVRSYLFQNSSQSALSCEDPSAVGEESTGVTAGEFQGELLWADFNLTEAQQTLLASLTAQQHTDIQNGSATANHLVQWLNLELAQATEFLSQRGLLISRIEESVDAALIQRRVCRFYNVAATFTCAASFSDTTSYPPAVFHPAGASVATTNRQFSSLVSQDDVDAIAEAWAVAQLNCLYASQAGLQVTCVDLGLDQATASVGGVKTVTAPSAGIATSANNQREADDAAKLLLLADLDCYYENAVVVLACDDETAISNPVTYGVTSEPGNPVTVPAGAFISRVSKADADFSANNAAFLQRQCRWLGSETGDCPSVEVDGVTILPDMERSVIPDVVTMESLISQEHADELAREFFLLNRLCIYCNPEILPTCIGQTSLDETPGVPAGVFCGEDARTVFETARSIGSLPASVRRDPATELCRVGNDRLTAKCVGPDLLSSSDTLVVPANQFIAFSKEEANTQALEFIRTSLACRFGNSEQTHTCPEDSDTQPLTLTLPAGSIVSTSTALRSSSTLGLDYEAYDLAAMDYNAQAQAMLASLHRCLYSNDEQRADDCPPGQASLAEPEALIVPAGRLPSMVSKADANMQARYLAQASQSCIDVNLLNAVCNTEVVANPCPPGTTRVGEPPVVAECTVRAATLAAANALAQGIAQSRQTCLPELPCNELQVADPCAEGTEPYPAEVSVAAGAICLESLEASNTVAKSIANASRFCLPAFAAADPAYGNDAQQADPCPEGTSAAPAEFSIPANTIHMPTKEQANATAKSMANAGRVCIPNFVLDSENYCNDEQAADACPESFSAYPETSVVAAGVICMPSKEQANTTARSIANSGRVCIPSFASGDVSYCNDEQTSDPCPEGQEGDPMIVEAGRICLPTKEMANDTAKLIANSKQVCVWSFAIGNPNFCNDEQVADECPEDLATTGPLPIVAAGSICMPTKQQANESAKATANSARVCLPEFIVDSASGGLGFCNDEQISDACPDDSDAYPGTAVVAAGIYCMPSKAQANKVAKDAANAQRTCLVRVYASAEAIASDCQQGTLPLWGDDETQRPRVPAGAFTAPTQLAADNLAQQAVNNLKICVPNTGDLGSALPSGQSGPRGATGNCNQGCSAHYA